LTVGVAEPVATRRVQEVVACIYEAGGDRM
jgi:hypothetical protein